jgi:hypothetical protein
MRINHLFTRRAAVTLAAVLGLSLLSGAATAAAKRAPDVTGEWQGVLNAESFPAISYTLDITTQNKKTGKFTGQATLPEQKPVSLSGKIQPNRKVKAKFSGDLNGQPVDFSVKVKVSSDVQSAEGTFTGKDEEGNVVFSGTTTLERVPEKG